MSCLMGGCAIPSAAIADFHSLPPQHAPLTPVPVKLVVETNAIGVAGMAFRHRYTGAAKDCFKRTGRFQIVDDAPNTFKISVVDHSYNVGRSLVNLAKEAAVLGTGGAIGANDTSIVDVTFSLTNGSQPAKQHTYPMTVYTRAGLTSHAVAGTVEFPTAELVDKIMENAFARYLVETETAFSGAVPSGEM